MEDFPVCSSSERTNSELPPFCRGAVKPVRFYRKVVSANLFADILPKSIDCTAQSLRPYGPAPFTQGSLSVYPPACLNCPPNFNLSGCYLWLLCFLYYRTSVRKCQVEEKGASSSISYGKSAEKSSGRERYLLFMPQSAIMATGILKRKRNLYA